MEKHNLYDFAVPSNNRFDLVIFAGVLYHLRFPFLGLKRIADALKPGGRAIIEKGAAGVAEQGGKFRPRVLRTPVDDADRLHTRSWARHL
jgi:SAM-dependent methyltransferase